MGILARHVVVELVKSFLAALLALSLLWLIVGVAKQAVDQALSPLGILQLVPFLLPEVLRLTAPISCVFAVSAVYGRMAGANEFVAAKALGIHPFALISPALFAAALLSLAAVVLNDLAATWGRDGVERVVSLAIEETAYTLLERNRCYVDHRFSIVVKQVAGRMLVKPTIVFRGSPDLSVMAEEGEMYIDQASCELCLVLRQGVAKTGSLTYSFDWEERRLAALSPNPNPPPTRMSLRALADAFPEAHQTVSQRDAELATELAFDLALGNVGQISDRGEWEETAVARRDPRLYLWRLATEVHRRWAMGFSCLAFVLLAAPLAVWLRRPEPYASFGVAFSLIIIIYYPVLMLTLGYAKDGIWPASAIWLSNAIMLAPAAWFWREMSRH